MWNAYPIASSPEVQPVDTVCTGPWAPTSSATADASELGANARSRYRPDGRWSTSQREPEALTAT